MATRRRRHTLRVGRQTQSILPMDVAEPTNESADTPLSKDLRENLTNIASDFAHCYDFTARTFRVGGCRDVAVAYMDSLSDTERVDDYLIRSLQGVEFDDEQIREYFHPEAFSKNFIYTSEVERVSTLETVVAYILQAKVVLLIDGETSAIALSMTKRKSRGIQEPMTEAVIRGPREGFNEDIHTSISLLRRRLPTNEFKLEGLEIGRYTKTQVVVCYIEDIVDEGLVNEVLTRVRRIEIDGILDSGYIEELIEDSPYSPFPQIQNTERPDVVVAQLLEGRVAILCDGSPFALVAPVNLWGALTASEDHYERYMISNAVRWLRYFFLFLALFLPSLYVAISTFHQEMLPTKLLFTVAAAREVTPYPAVIEALIMEISFEALREAGVRLPRTIGSSISIVGALVIGEAAVQAGIVSAPMVIIVALTGIASFCIPRYNFAIALRLLRFPMIILAGTLGLFGIVVGFIAVVIHLSGLRSFGVPYLQPLSPLSVKGLKDTFIRVPRWAMKSRPVHTAKGNLVRQSSATRPKSRLPRH